MMWLNNLSGLLALVALEIVLGIDNLIFLAIFVAKLPPEKRVRARVIGLTMAWIMRLVLLLSALWMIKWTRPLITLGDLSFSIRDFLLILGGVFLIAKATQEIHQEVEPQQIIKKSSVKISHLFSRVVLQIAVMDLVFSFDSVLTAIGLTNNIYVMFCSITIAILVMLYASESVGKFIAHHPTVKMLALSFLILIGTLLVADGLSFHVPRGYLYFAMGFAFSVEYLNLLKRARHQKDQ